MRKLDLTSYDVTVGDSGGSPRTVPYQIRESVVSLLFNPDLKLGAVELLKQDKLARKVFDCPDDHIILEEEEYERVKRAIDAVRGLGRNDVEFVRRILESPEVKVQATQ